MPPFGKHLDRAQQLRDLSIRIAVPEYWQSKRRLCDERIAQEQLEGRAGRVCHILVIARGDHARAIRRHANLRRAEHMPGRVERYVSLAELQLLAIADRLCRSGKILAV